jgi:hypothetical protein
VSLPPIFQKRWAKAAPDVFEKARSYLIERCKKHIIKKIYSDKTQG